MNGIICACYKIAELKFRQPDCSPDGHLAGSYAVYRKETIVHPTYTTGTGKMCHIHRPRIVDALGREMWEGIYGLIGGTIHHHIGTLAWGGEVSGYREYLCGGVSLLLLYL
ncbi:MAG: hypothetical protein LBK62_08310 [Treponema sp.]|nr:hypothetical protein [Treponema sp.]